VGASLASKLSLGVYRSGSQALSTIVFDDLSVVFNQLAMYQDPAVICGDFNIHVDVSTRTLYV